MTASPGPRTKLYDRVAEETASIVIRRYSTSFGLAARLLEPRVRQHIENIYAKLGVSTRAEAGLFAVKHGLLPETGFEPDEVATSG